MVILELLSIDLDNIKIRISSILNKKIVDIFEKEIISEILNN